MIVQVTIAEETRGWRLLDAGAVVDWLASEPWVLPREPLAVRLPEGALVDVQPDLLAEVRRWATSEVTVADIEAKADVRNALADWMGLQDNGLRSLGEHLSKVARRAPTLLVVTAREGAKAGSLLEDMRVVQDIALKVPSGRPCAFLLLTRGPQAPASSRRLMAAWPVAEPDRGPEHWASYVHERVAWHSAGDLDRATRAAGQLANLRAGDDAALEQALADHAQAEYLSLASGLREELSRGVARVRALPHLCIESGVPDNTGSTGGRPAPWLARALLQSTPKHPDRRYLALIDSCRPLADRLMGRCQNLEQRCRDRLLGDTRGRTCEDEKANSRCEEYKSGTSYEYRLAERLHPNVEPWDFASFHSVLARFRDRVGSNAVNQMHDLRLIRNALAHGGPVGWKAVKAVASLERALS